MDLKTQKKELKEHLEKHVVNRDKQGNITLLKGDSGEHMEIDSSKKGGDYFNFEDVFEDGCNGLLMFVGYAWCKCPNGDACVVAEANSFPFFVMTNGRLVFVNNSRVGELIKVE